MSHDRSHPGKKPDNKTTNIPGVPDVITKGIASNLGMKSQTQLAMVSQASHTLFQKQTAANHLLSLVANYNLTKAEFIKHKENTPAPESKEESPIKNPILLAVNAFLEKDPSLALTKGSVTDPSGRTRHDSPLEYAYWSGNFFVCQMILEKVKGKPDQEKKAFAQIRLMQDKATNYDVVLLPTLSFGKSIDDILASLKTKPTLIKYFNAVGDPKMSLWGDLNGRWQLTELNDKERELFSPILFPPSSSDLSEIFPQSKITVAMFNVLKKGHTVSQYDLSELTRKYADFLRNYPAGVQVPYTRGKECDAYALKLIGITQRYLPAWIAQLWCSKTPFSPTPNFANLIMSVNLTVLKLYDDRRFFDLGPEEDFSLFKGPWGVAQRVKPARETSLRACGMAPIAAGYDAEAMAAVCELMKVEFGKIFEQLLAFENLPEISSEADRPLNSSL